VVDEEVNPQKKKLVRHEEDLGSESHSEYVPVETIAYNLVIIVNPGPIYESICQDFKYS
jgi:hypothetical protein